MSDWYDKKWILSRLPDDIPQDIVERAFKSMGFYYVKDDPLEVWCVGEREADHVAERFVSERLPEPTVDGRRVSQCPDVEEKWEELPCKCHATEKDGLPNDKDELT